MSHEAHEDVIPLSAIGALDRQERQALDRHLLAGCAPCHQTFRQLQTVAALLPFSLAPAAPSSELKTRLLAAIQEDPSKNEAKKYAESLLEQAKQHRRWSWQLMVAWLFHPVVPLVLLIALGGAAAYSVHLQKQVSTLRTERQRAQSSRTHESSQLTALKRQIEEQEAQLARLRRDLSAQAGSATDLTDMLIQRDVEVDQLRRQVFQQEKDIALLRRALVQRDELGSFLRSPTVRVVPLHPPSGPDGLMGGLVLFDPDSRQALLYTYNLPSPPAGRAYQFWALGEAPVSGGTFVPDIGRKSRLLARSLPEESQLVRFAVTIEAEGGQSVPSTEWTLIGEL